MTPTYSSTPRFGARADRTRWLYEHFRPIFASGTVLDVGCYEAPLRELVGRDRYTGVDFAGRPDIELNLETCTALPFADGAFDTVICIEVLEHLDNLHALVGELFRVARGNVLVSLPNAWRDARMKIERGHGQIAHYGLPVQRPMDRHKWFFNVTDASGFLASAAPAGWRCEIEVTEPARHPLLRMLRRLRYSQEAYGNRYAQTVWALYRRG